MKKEAAGDFKKTVEFETAKNIAKKLVDQGFEAYFAGGCVRDLLLGRPAQDIDIATSAHPEQVLSLFEKSFPKGESFGVVSVMEQDREYEIATFRTEGKYSDGRHPDEVSFSSAEQDAQRRDFSINGMFFDPIKEAVIDFVGGKDDLKKKLIRAIGEPAERFKEDKLRLMRAIRFSAALDFELEKETKEALLRFGPLIYEVSVERIRDELLKTLVAPRCSLALNLLSESGILLVILPEVHAMKGVEQPPQFHPEGDVWKHTLMALDLLENPAPEVALATLLHDVGKPPTFYRAPDRIRFDFHTSVGAHIALRICKRFRLSNKQTDHIVDLVDQHLRFIDVKRMRKSTLKRFLWQEKFENHLELHRVDCLASHGDLEAYAFCKKELEVLKKAHETKPPTPLLTGDDLIALGLTPGPLFSEILSAVMDAQIESELKTKDEALAFIQKKFLK